MAGGHLDRRTVKRKGYFQKHESGMPHPNYRTSTSDGFKGARWDAHHVLPQTSIESAVGEFSGDKNRYIKDVQYMTDWVINNPGNMLGMPQFSSFLFYYQVQEGKVKASNPQAVSAGEQGKVLAYASTFNSASKADRLSWFKNLSSASPEGYPVHRPVSWGHVKYNDEVQADIKTKIFNPLNEAKKKHDTDAATVAGALSSMSTRLKAKLRARGGGTSLARWQKRYDRADTSWYTPFTMTNVPENPLFA